MVVEFQNNSSWTFEQEEIVTAGDTTIVIESLSIPLFSSLTSSFFSILRPSFDTESFEDEPPNLLGDPGFVKVTRDLTTNSYCILHQCL